jgi:hypothetical protein
MPDLFAVAVAAVQSGLAFAQQHLLTAGSSGPGSDCWPSWFTDTDRARARHLLRTDSGFTARELLEHPGNAPIDADRQGHVLMAAILTTAFPGSFVVGEEATDREWIAAEHAEPDSLIFSLDALDGSQPYDTLTFGYSTNLLAYRRGHGNDLLLLSVVANCSGFLMAYQSPAIVKEKVVDVSPVLARRARRQVADLARLGKTPSVGLQLLAGARPADPGSSTALSSTAQLGTVHLGTLAAQVQRTQPAAATPRPGTVAVVAASPRQRARATQLLSSDLTVFTTGGAPAALGLAIGRLAALVCPVPQSIHDGAYLPALAALGVSIHPLHGPALCPAAVLGLFSRVARSREDRVARPLPAFAAARSDEFAEALVMLLTANPAG